MLLLRKGSSRSLPPFLERVCCCEVVAGYYKDGERRSDTGTLDLKRVLLLMSSLRLKASR